MPPLVSVLILVYNEEKLVPTAIKSVLSQDYPNLEIIVVDNGSVDNTYNVVKKYTTDKRVKIVHIPKNIGIARALNKGLSHCSGEYFLYLQDDCSLVGKDWIKKALDDFKDPKVAVVAGGLYIREEDFRRQGVWEQIFMLLRQQLFDQTKIEEINFDEGRAAVYKIDILKKIGFFSQKLRASGEDVLACYRIRNLGYKLIRDPNLKVNFSYGSRATTLFSNIRKEFDYAKVQPYIFKVYGLFSLKTTGSKQMNSRIFHRYSQAVFIPLLIVLLFLYDLVRYDLKIYVFSTIISILLLRGIYFLKLLSNKKYSLELSTKVIGVGIGLLTDLFYFSGLVWGIFKLLKDAVGV